LLLQQKHGNKIGLNEVGLKAYSKSLLVSKSSISEWHSEVK